MKKSTLSAVSVILLSLLCYGSMLTSSFSYGMGMGSFESGKFQDYLSFAELAIWGGIPVVIIGSIIAVVGAVKSWPGWAFVLLMMAMLTPSIVFLLGTRQLY